MNLPLVYMIMMALTGVAPHPNDPNVLSPTFQFLSESKPIAMEDCLRYAREINATTLATKLTALCAPVLASPGV